MQEIWIYIEPIRSKSVGDKVYSHEFVVVVNENCD